MRLSFLIPLLIFLSTSVSGYALPISQKGQVLRNFIMEQRVDQKWLPKSYVNWETGTEIHPSAEELKVKQYPFPSHCSGYVAAVAKKLSIPFLNPNNSPAGHVMLANHQSQWLSSVEAKEAGWKKISVEKAQILANEGDLVIAAIRNPNPEKPGHIAIVLPDKEISEEELKTSGPVINQSGSPSPKVKTGNALRVTTLDGFYFHIKKLPDPLHQIEFFSHDVKSLVKNLK